MHVCSLDNIMQHTSATLILAIFLLLLSKQVIGQESVQADRVNDKVKLATGEGYSPYVDKNMPDGGWSISLIKQTFNKMNLDVSIEILPWKRALKWTEEGEFLGTFPFVFSEQRANEFIFSTPINHVPVHMYVSSQSNYSKPSDLMNKRLCFPLGYSLGIAVKSIIERYQMSVNRTKDGRGCVLHVQKGWSDAGLTNGHMQANKFVLDPKLDNKIVILPEQLALVPLHLVIAKNTVNAQQWMEKFDHAFFLLGQSGEKSATDAQFIKLLEEP